MVGLFKRYNGSSVENSVEAAGLKKHGRDQESNKAVLADIVRSYVALVSMSGFVEMEVRENGGIGRDYGSQVGVGGIASTGSGGMPGGWNGGFS